MFTLEQVLALLTGNSTQIASLTARLNAIAALVAELHAAGAISQEQLNSIGTALTTQQNELQAAEQLANAIS